MLTEERTRGARFSRCWIKLKPSLRLDPRLIPILQDYTEDFLRKEKVYLLLELYKAISISNRLNYGRFIYLRADRR